MTHSILVVDSDNAFATIIKEGLETSGEFQVTLTHAGGDALESVVERHFDLVIVDMNEQATIDRRRLYTKQKDAARMFDGWQVVGMPVMTIVRGTVIMRDGEIVGRPGYGQFISPLRRA